jgi:Flp pilus assembly protein TadD/alkyl hydroperoxide reductase subunit AhpC
MNRNGDIRGWKYLTLILTLVIIIAVAEASAAFKYAAVGMEAHDFTGEDIISGNKISIGDLHRDHLVIVVFWATWSPRSLTQLAEMKVLKDEYVGRNIEVVAVNVDAPKLSVTVRTLIAETVKEMDIKFPVIIDEGLEIFYTYGVIAVPSTAIVDTSGTLRYDPGGYGLLTRDIIEDSIKVFLGIDLDKLKTKPPKGYQPKPKSARYFNLALNLKKTGMLDRALENLDLAFQADSLFPTPYTLRGEILLQLGRFEEADSVFARAADLDSTGVTIWAGWGRTLMYAGKTDEAREKLAYALALNDSYTPALIDLGLCLAKQDDYDAAIDSISKASELNRGDPMIYYYLGQVYRQAGREGEAALAYLKALSIIYPEN